MRKRCQSPLTENPDIVEILKRHLQVVPKELPLNGMLPTRALVRLFTVCVNSVMLLYVYTDYLKRIDWSKFGSLRNLPHGKSPNAIHHLLAGDIDWAFDLLGIFTFSDALLDHIPLYMIVGTLVAVSYFVLEKQRIRWIQSLIRASMLLDEEKETTIWWLEQYLRSFGLTLSFILLIGPFHLNRPVEHYMCAAGAFSMGCLSITLYLWTPLDSSAIKQSGASCDELEALSFRKASVVRPILLFVLALHVVAACIGALKVTDLGNDCRALAFGIAETSVVVAYQLFQAVFIFDDVALSQATCRKYVCKDPLKVEASSHTSREFNVPETLLGS